MARPVLLLAFLAPVLADIGMKFSRQPQSVTAPLGDVVTFECAVTVPPERVTWRRRDGAGAHAAWTDVDAGAGAEREREKLRASPSRSYSSKLSVRVTPPDYTLYQCVVWYGGIVLASLPARLAVARLQPPPPAQPPPRRDVTVPQYNPVALHCPEVESEPAATYSWWRHAGGERRAVSSERVLLLSNATRADTGLYGCSASNVVTGQDVGAVAEARLHVVAEPRPLQFVESEELCGAVGADGALEAGGRAGRPLALHCGAVGTPAPSVTWAWARDNRQRAPAPALFPHLQALHIDALSPDTDGTYSCEARGAGGAVIRREWRVRCARAPAWAGAGAGGAPVNASEGGAAVVRCPDVTGYPPPSLTWMLNARPIDDEPGITVQGTTLHIARAEKRHAGIVQCFATNSAGAIYDAILLTVVPTQIPIAEYAGDGQPSYTTKSPNRNRHRKHGRKHNKAAMIPPSAPNVTRMSDMSVMVSWTVPKGQSLPIQFFKVQYREANSKKKKDWETFDLDIPRNVRTYEVDNLKPDTYYKFRIAAVYSNLDHKLGHASARFHLRRASSHQRTPPPPQLALAAPIDHRTILLNWTVAGGGAAIEGFYVYYRPQSKAGSYEKSTIVGGGARQATLDNLQPDTRYEIKVQSYTSYMPSAFSDRKIVRTLRDEAKKDKDADKMENSVTAEEGGKAGGAGGAEGVGGAGGGAAPPPARSALATAAGAVGAAALLAVVPAALLCRRYTATKEKAGAERNGGSGAGGGGGGGAGFLLSKPRAPTSAAPVIENNENGGVEMSLMHNNNAPLPHNNTNYM